MKTVMVVVVTALLGATGSVGASEPIDLTEHELDHVTAGSHVNLEEQIKTILERMPDSLHDTMKARLERLGDVGHAPAPPE